MLKTLSYNRKVHTYYKGLKLQYVTLQLSDAFCHTDAKHDLVVADESSPLDKSVSASNKNLLKATRLLETKLQQPSITTLTQLVQSSTDLQQLVSCGVSLTAIEKHEGAPDLIANLSFEGHMKGTIQLLLSLGVTDVGELINKCPYILIEGADSIKHRILYLSGRGFTQDQIIKIVTKCPKWLCESSSEIDGRLGAVQQLLELKGKEIRQVATLCPKLIISDSVKLKRISFIYRECYGLTKYEMKSLVLKCPTALLIGEKALKAKMDYLQDCMKIPVSRILEWPLVLKCRERILRERHMVLQQIGRDIFETNEPGYISIRQMVSCTDDEFCLNIAKINREQFYDFIKTL